MYIYQLSQCKHIHLVIKHLKVPMKSLNVWNEEIFCEVLGEHTTTAAMKEDIQRDMDHLYVLLDQCTDENILQQIRKNKRAALNLVEVNNKSII